MSSVAWQQFLITQGAQFNEQAEASFALTATPASAQLFDLSTLGLIAVSGSETQTFLQGQFTNDIKQASHTTAQFTGYCTAKGRLLALFYAFSMNEVIYLQCPRAMVPDLVKRLRMFVLRSKVAVEDVSDQFVLLGLAGAQLAANIAELHAEPHHLSQHTLGTLIRLPDSGSQQRAQLIISTQPEIAWSMLSGQFNIGSTSQWESLEVQAGIPQIYPATKEQFVPQMINLDALDGINFKKGCYTGQEIVARTHYLGKVKRRALLAQLPATTTPPLPGDTLLDAQQQEAGQLVRVAPSTEGRYWVLAECRLEAKEAGAIFWQGQLLDFQPMPYTFP